MLKNFVKIFGGDPNKKTIEQFRAIAQQINSLEPQFEALSDEVLRAKTDEFRARIAESVGNVEGLEEKEQFKAHQDALEEILPEAFATVKSAARRMVGRKMYGGSSTYIPLKVNQAGVIPVIFASSLLYLPALAAQFNQGKGWANWINDNFVRGDHPVYMLTFFLLIVFFTYFYVSITFNPKEVADNMKKYGGFIPGIRAGRPTEQYLGYVLSRITFPGSLYLGLVALIPLLAFLLVDANQNFPFGGTTLLIIVGVGLDTVKQIESQLQQRNYEGFLK